MGSQIACFLTVVLCALVVPIAYAEDVDGQAHIWAAVALLDLTLNARITSRYVEIFVPVTSTRIHDPLRGRTLGSLVAS